MTKSGARFRRSRRGSGLPRIMWVAIAVCIIGAVLIFRNQGDQVPTGIGEYQTVVTAPDQEQTLPDETEPRSGDVDISDQTTSLTPEKPAGGTTGTSDDKAATTPPVEQATVTPKATTPKTTQPAAPPITPVASGPYLVQTGSFGDPENADKEAARLKKLGFDARVKMGNTSDNSLIYRVRIGYFKSRTEAEAFIQQNRKKMPGAIPAHR